MTSSVRPAVAADLDAVASVEARVFADQAWSPRSIEEEFAELGRSRRIVVAVAGERVVGHAVLLAVGDLGDLTRVAVDRPSRREGVGARLVDALVGEASGLGLDAVLLEVADANTAAIALYERTGFEVIDRRARYYPDGSDALVMRRLLGASGDGAGTLAGVR